MEDKKIKYLKIIIGIILFTNILFGILNFVLVTKVVELENRIITLEK